MHSLSSKLAPFVHAFQAVLIIAAMSLTVPRLSMDYQYKKKENLLALTIVCYASHRTSDTKAN